MGDESGHVAAPILTLLSAVPSLLVGGAGRIVFVSVLETSGAASASFTYFDGLPSSNQVMCDFSVSANGSTREPYTDHGLPFEGDLTIGNVNGAARVITWVVPEDQWDIWKRDYWRGFEAAVLQGGYP